MNGFLGGDLRRRRRIPTSNILDTIPLSLTYDGNCNTVNPAFTITNTYGIPVTVTVTGSVDDELLIDGAIYEPGAYPFDWGFLTPTPFPCGTTNSTNGAHTISPYVRNLSPGQSFTIGGKSYKATGTIDCVAQVVAQ